MTENYIPPKTISELLERYENGERDFVGCDFYDQTYDLRNLNLKGINLSETFIFADFRRANLRNANFYRANVKSCDFRGADLTNAVFKDAAIDFALFEGAKFNNTDIEGAWSLKKGEVPD